MTCLYYLQSNEISLKDHNNIEINKLQAETIVPNSSKPVLDLKICTDRSLHG